MKLKYILVTVLFFLALLIGAWMAVAQTTGRTAFGNITIEANSVEGTPGGTVLWKDNVSVTSSEGLTLTCDSLKVWPAKKGQSFDRIEAYGDVRVRGVYTTAQKVKWNVDGSAKSAVYDNKTSEGILTGDVNIKATNTTTKETVSIQADVFTYNQKTQKFHFERKNKNERVRAQFERPASPGEGGAAQ